MLMPECLKNMGNISGNRESGFNGKTGRRKILRLSLLVFVMSLAIFCSGCAEKEELKPVVETKSSHGAKKITAIVVPPDVAASWKSVGIAVLNKPAASQKTYMVPIGGKLAVPSSSMLIEVETFLPAFIMQGATITSISNKLTNPAAKVRISEKGTTIFQGWLFLLHQNTHVLIHPTYGFSLVEAIPKLKR